MGPWPLGWKVSSCDFWSYVISPDAVPCDAFGWRRALAGPRVHGSTDLPPCSDEDELRVKEETSATIRCFPFDQPAPGKCFFTGEEGAPTAIFAKSY